MVIAAAETEAVAVAVAEMIVVAEVQAEEVAKNNPEQHESTNDSSGMMAWPDAAMQANRKTQQVMVYATHGQDFQMWMKMTRTMTRTTGWT